MRNIYPRKNGILCLICLVMLCVQTTAINAQNNESREHYISYQSDIAHGSVLYVWYNSSYMKEARRLAIYLPPSYFNNKKDYYPVLYLLHGTFGYEENWVRRGAANTIDMLIAEGKAKEMIVVMPNTNMWQQASADCTGIPDPCNTLESASALLTDGRFETCFSEIMSFVEQNFRTLNKKQYRAIAGLSRGGFFAMHISHYLNSVFDYVGLFSPTINTAGGMQNVFDGNLFPANRQTPKVYKQVLKDLSRQFNNPPRLYWIAIGRDDYLYKENQMYMQLLDSNHYPYTYHESEGGHQWENWQDYLIIFAPELFK